MLSSCSLKGGFRPTPCPACCPHMLFHPFLSLSSEPPGGPDPSQGPGLPLAPGPSHKILRQPWLVLTVLPYPSRSHPQATKPSPEALNPSFIAHSSLVLHKSEIEKVSEKVKKTLQSLLGVAKARVLVPHSHPAPGAGEPPCLFSQEPTLLPGQQGLRTQNKPAHNQEVEKGAVGHLAPAAV